MKGNPEKTADDVTMSGEASENQLVVAANEYLHPLQPYGPKKALREMTRRIMTLDTAKGEKKLLAVEAAHLAQVSASSLLNPFMGEIWAWIQIKQGVRHLSIMPGRRGLLRHAHEQARAQDTHFWPEYDQIDEPDERDNMLIPQGALAFHCRLKEHKAIESWVMAVNALKDAGYKPAEIKAEVGHMPHTPGLGILTDNEMKDLDKNKSNKMSHVERCQKRAYMMALKQRFDLPLGGSVGDSGETIDDYVVEGDWREVDEPRAEDDEKPLVPKEDETTPRAGHDPSESEVEHDPSESGALFDDEQPQPIKIPKARKWNGEVVTAVRATEHFPKNAASKRIVMTLNLSPFVDADPFEWIDEWIGIYKGVRESIEEPKQAASIATRKWAIAHKSDKNAHARFGEKVIKNWAK